MAENVAAQSSVRASAQAIMRKTTSHIKPVKPKCFLCHQGGRFRASILNYPGGFFKDNQIISLARFLRRMDLSNCTDLEAWGAERSTYGGQKMNSPAESQTRGVSAGQFSLRTFPWLPGCPHQPGWTVQVWGFQGALAPWLCFDMREPDPCTINLGRGSREQGYSRILVELPTGDPSWPLNQPVKVNLLYHEWKSQAESEDVPRGTEQGLGTGLVATELLQGCSLQSHVLCHCPHALCSPHVSFPLPSIGSFPSLI